MYIYIWKNVRNGNNVAQLQIAFTTKNENWLIFQYINDYNYYFDKWRYTHSKHMGNALLLRNN